MSVTEREAPNEWLSPKDAAELLGVSPATLNRYASAGRIACLELPSGHRRYRRADLDALFKAAS